MLTHSEMNDLFFVEKLQFHKWGNCFTLHNSVNPKCVKNALVVRKNRTLEVIYGVKQGNDSIVYYKTTYNPLTKKNLNWKTELLSKLDLSCTNITGEDLNSLDIDFPKLEKLNLSSCKKLTDKCLKSILSKCHNLKELDLSRTNITGEDFDSLDIDFPKLEKLDLFSCKKLTDKGLNSILSISPNLKKLNL